MAASKRDEQQRRDAWGDTKAAVRAYAQNPCMATEQAVSAAIGKVRALPVCAPRSQARPRQGQNKPPR